MNISGETEDVVSCAVCSNQASGRDCKFEKLLGLKDPYEVQECKNCKLRWLSPRPSPAAYMQLYENEDYLSSEETYTELAKERAPYFNSRVKKIETYFPNKNKIDILDYGAATGEFVNEALKCGHKTEGIELSVEARADAKKLYNIDLSSMSLDGLEDNSFDVIHMNHVFEHLGDPNKALAECKRVLIDGGLLIIEIPQQFYNDLDRLKKLLGMKARVSFNIYSLHHTYFYTPNSLNKVLENNDFQVSNLCTANFNRTPIQPFKLSNLILGVFLWMSDKIHRGGNIIEVYAINKHKPVC